MGQGSEKCDARRYGCFAGRLSLDVENSAVILRSVGEEESAFRTLLISHNGRFLRRARRSE